MMDDFCEYIIKRKRDAKDIALVVLTVIAALFLTFVILVYVFTYLFYTIPNLTTFIPLLCAAVWYGAYRLIKLKSIEFEYALTAGELDVDKIINKKKRQRLLNIHSRAILDMASVSSGRYSDNYKQLKTIDASGNNSDENVYFAVFEADGQKQCLLFEPPKKMLEMMRRYNPDKITM